MSDKNLGLLTPKVENKTAQHQPRQVLFGFDDLETEKRFDKTPTIFQSTGELIFNKTTYMLADTGNAVYEIYGAGKDIVGMIAPELFKEENSEPTPKNLTQEQIEAQKKQAETQALIAQNNKIIENEIANNKQVEYEQMVRTALRMGVNVENLANNLNNPNLRKEMLLHVYYIALGASEQEAKEKIAEEMQKQQSMSETGPKTNLEMSLNAHEGNSKVANAISTAG